MKAAKIAILALSVGLLGTTAASAQPRTTINLRSIDRNLAKLPLGKNMKSAMRWVRARVTRHYLAQLREARTPEDQRRLNWRIMREVREIQKSIVVFDGKHDKQLERTVIAGEFASKSGESMLRFVDGGTEHYLFFFEGKLWKYARTMVLEGQEFGDRVAWLTASFSVPPMATYSSDGSEEGVSEASWTTSEIELRLAKRPERFGGDLLILQSPRLAREVARRRANIGNTRKGYSNPELMEFLEQGEEG